MNDTISLRDHSQPCEHKNGGKYQHPVPAGDGISKWGAAYDICPGGKEIVLRRPTKNEVNMPGVWVDMTGWVEAADE